MTVDGRGPLVAISEALVAARHGRDVDTAPLRAELVHYADQAGAELHDASDAVARWAWRAHLVIAEAGQRAADLLDAGDLTAAVEAIAIAMRDVSQDRHPGEDRPASRG